MIYQEFTSYSPFYDAYVTRLSTCDDQGHEYFCLLPRIPRARDWRELRANALEQLSEAIASGAEPGEIKPRLDA